MTKGELFEQLKNTPDDYDLMLFTEELIDFIEIDDQRGIIYFYGEDD